MTNPLHQTAPLGEIHSPVNWTFTTDTNRRAVGPYVLTDLGGECMQTDTSPPTFWKLVAIASPGLTATPTWRQITTVADVLIVSPLVTMVGHIKGMFEATSGLSTSLWVDQSPSATNIGAGGGMLNGSDSGGPYAQATGAHYFQNGWTPPGFGTSPVVLDVIVQQDAYNNQSPFVSAGTGGACGVQQGASSGNMRINNGSTIAAAFALGAFKRVRAIFTGATSGTADSVKVGGAAAVTGFAGATAPGSLSIGANFGAFFVGKWRAIYAYDAIPSGLQAAALDAWYESKWPGVTT